MIDTDRKPSERAMRRLQELILHVATTKVDHFALQDNAQIIALALDDAFTAGSAAGGLALKEQLAELAAIRPCRGCHECTWGGFDETCPECGKPTELEYPDDPLKSIRETIIWLWEDLDNAAPDIQRDRLIEVATRAVAEAIRKELKAEDDSDD